MPEYGTDMPDLETWENVTLSRFVIKKFGAKGDLIDEMIGGKRRFHITTQERHINEELAAEDEMDPFKNGNMAPVRLLDSTDDAEQIASNPNLLSEGEMVGLLKGNVKALRSRLGDVRNPALLQRLSDLAETEDASVSKANAIRDRLREVAPNLYTEVTAASADAGGLQVHRG